MKRSTLAATALLFASAVSGNAAVLVAYNFNSDTLANSTTTVGYAVTSLSFPTATVGVNSVGYAANGAGNRKLLFANTDWEETAALSIAAGQFLTFSMTADSGNTFNLASLALDHSRTNSAPRQLGIYASTNVNPTFTLLQTFSNGNASTPPALGPVDLTNKSIAFNGVSTVSFRLVSFDDNTSPGVAQFDNIVVNGTVVPEPSSFALLLGGLGMLQILRRRPSV